MTHQLIQFGFGILTLLSYYFLISEIRKGVQLTNWPSEVKIKFNRYFIFGLVAWVAFLSIWSLSGKMKDFTLFPLNLMPVLVIPFISIVWFSLSKTGKEILTHIPKQKIIALQSFRFFVELLLWALFIENTAPIQMTFEGRNLDVLSGLTAPIIALLYAKAKISKLILAVWNIACLGLLVNIVTIAILSMPTPLRVFMNEPVNTVVTEFPISLLPGLLVPLAYGLHFFSLRQLTLKN